jgi:hypothetical protein
MSCISCLIVIFLQYFLVVIHASFHLFFLEAFNLYVIFVKNGKKISQIFKFSLTKNVWAYITLRGSKVPNDNQHK